MRASEALALTSQADAAFLLRLVKDGIPKDIDRGQLLKTLKIMKTSVLRAQEGGHSRMVEV